MTSRKHKSFTNAVECKYEFVHTELVQVFYDIKWISSGAFEFEKKHKQQTVPKNRSRHTKKAWFVKCNKTITALHFVKHWKAILTATFNPGQYCFSVLHSTSYRTQ